MIEIALLAFAVVGGVDWRRLAVLSTVALAPIAGVAVVLVVVWRSRRREDSRGAVFCENVASDLRSGASLKSAISASAAAVGLPQLSEGRLGAPIGEIAAEVGAEFPEIGEELRTTVMSAARSGSRAADLFDEIGSVAIAEAEVSHEVRVATAPARSTALVFLAVPTVYLALQARAGDLSGLLAVPQQRVVALAGLGLFLLGLTAAIVIIWRVR